MQSSRTVINTFGHTAADWSKVLHEAATLRDCLLGPPIAPYRVCTVALACQPSTHLPKAGQGSEGPLPPSHLLMPRYRILHACTEKSIAAPAECLMMGYSMHCLYVSRVQPICANVYDSCPAAPSWIVLNGPHPSVSAFQRLVNSLILFHLREWYTRSTCRQSACVSSSSHTQIHLDNTDTTLRHCHTLLFSAASIHHTTRSCKDCFVR